MKKFSVCIAFYNQMKYIEEALISVFNQDYDNIEVILTDDASTDFDEIKLREIEKKYNKKNFDFKIVRNEVNSGIVKNVNNGFKEATGDYLLFFAGDDKLYNNEVITNFVKSFDRNPSINVITSQSLSCDENLKYLKDGLFVDSKTANRMNNYSYKKAYYEMCKNCIYAIGATAFRREVFDKYGKFDENYKYVEDWPYYLKLLRNKERVYYEDFFTLLHRDGGISHNHDKEKPQHVLDYYKDMKRVYKKEIFGNIFKQNIFRIFSLILFIGMKYLKTKFRDKDYRNKHTFVICAYKESEYLEECVKSLINQSIRSKVMISTSTPNDYIKGIADKYMLELVINPNPGHANDFRYAYSQAKTKYVTLCHQDDIYYKDFGKKTVKKMEKCKKPIIAFTNYNEIRNNKVVKRNKLLIVKRIINFPLLLFKKSKRIRLLTLSVGNAICAPALTFNKDAVDNPIVEIDFKSNLDWITYIELAKMKGSFIYIHKQLLGRRIHADSLTTSVIANNIKHEEDYKIFRMFWSERIAKKLLKLYSTSEESNKL